MDEPQPKRSGLDWRLDRLERDMADSRSEMRDSLRAMNASAAAIQAQLAALQVQLPTQFVSRTDLAERETNIVKRMDNIEAAAVRLAVTADSRWTRMLFTVIGLTIAIILDFAAHLISPSAASGVLH